MLAPNRFALPGLQLLPRDPGQRRSRRGNPHPTGARRWAVHELLQEAPRQPACRAEGGAGLHLV
eukprot:6115691-Pyramimonas_sp.AAC.1